MGMNTGERIKQARLAAGLTQTELADKIDPCGHRPDPERQRELAALPGAGGGQGPCPGHRPDL